MTDSTKPAQNSTDATKETEAHKIIEHEADLAAEKGRKEEKEYDSNHDIFTK
jgi:hypothetical protein